MTTLLDWQGWPGVVEYISIGTVLCFALAIAALLARRFLPRAYSFPAVSWRLHYFRALRIATLFTLAWELIVRTSFTWTSGLLGCLLLSALVVCIWDRRLCGRELLYCLLIAILLVFVTPAGLA